MKQNEKEIKPQSTYLDAELLHNLHFNTSLFQVNFTLNYLILGATENFKKTKNLFF